ncbi:protein EURL homolog [Pleurodeles waltl]
METDTTPTTKVEREMTLSREQMQEKSMDALQLINRKILCRVRGVFKELSDALEQKDSLLWELQYRFITIEQLLKNREKLKMMQPGTPCPRAESEKGGDLGM